MCRGAAIDVEALVLLLTVAGREDRSGSDTSVGEEADGELGGLRLLARGLGRTGTWCSQRTVGADAGGGAGPTGVSDTVALERCTFSDVVP